jgi:hypothetical protein
VKHGLTPKDLADKPALEYGIGSGQDAINLHLTSGQYEAFKRIRP